MESKRRRPSLAWSLPLVVAVMFLVVVKLAALERADVIKELDKRVSHGSTDEATDAVRNLATIPRPPLALLVKAAASPNLEVAREGQQAIDEYLKFCQREVKAGRNSKLVTRQLAVLAEALAIEQHLFSADDHPWMERTARKVLRLANRIQSKSTPLVAARCDEILAKITVDRASATAPSTTALENLTLVSDANLSSDASRITEEGLTALASRPWGDAPAAASDGGSKSFPITLRGNRQVTPIYLDGTFSDSGEAELMPQEVRGESDWKAEWSHPVLKSLPAAPPQAAPKLRNSAESAKGGSTIEIRPQSPRHESAEPRFAGVSDRALLKRWLISEQAEALVLKQELAERGFGRLSRPLVEQLFSKQVEDRLELVDKVLTEPGVGARAWLTALADDANADVRLVAVTVMATSNDPALIEKAWQVVIRDGDPRIAGLAERLRERRDGGRRR